MYLNYFHTNGDFKGILFINKDLFEMTPCTIICYDIEIFLP